MTIRTSVSLLLLFTCSACGASITPSATAARTKGAAACPDAVRQSVTKQYPNATIASCQAEKVDGGDQFEVKLDLGGQKMEVDATADGTIVQTESVVDSAAVPAKVLAAFSAKYPAAKLTRAQKQVRTGKGTFYEIKFDGQPKAKEATFAEDGTFVEEE